MKWYIMILLLIIIIVVILSSFKYKNKIENYSNDIITCKDRILSYKNFNLNDLTEEQEKVLQTIIPLNATIYEDDTLEHPYWQNACVIPNSHLPIFNIDQNKKDDWIINNNKLRYTKVNETPNGYVIDLNKYDESSFKQLLSDLYLLYDKEFLDAKADLQKKIDQWTEAKKLKELELKEINADIENNQIILNNMINPDTDCQSNKTKLDDLLDQLNNQENKIVEIWQHCNYDGLKITLGPGKYKKDDLKKLGFVNNDISSIKFLKDGSIRLFTKDNFKGSELTLTNSVNCLVDYNFNDIVSSIIITQ